MSKERLHIQAALGLVTPLASLEDKGVYLNEDQLDGIESKMDSLVQANATLTQERDTALNNVNQDVSAATAQVTATETAVDAMLENSGLDVSGTLDEKIGALSAHVTEMNGKDGAAHTNPKTNGDNPSASNVIGGIDVSAALNN